MLSGNARKPQTPQIMPLLNGAASRSQRTAFESASTENGQLKAAYQQG